MILLLLVRRLSPRNRAIVGLVLVAAGLALIVVSSLAVAALIHGGLLAVFGAVLCVSAANSRRQARLTDRPGAASTIVPAGHSNGYAGHSNGY